MYIHVVIAGLDPAIDSVTGERCRNVLEWMPWSSHGMTIVLMTKGPLVRARDRALVARQEVVDPLTLLLESNKLRAEQLAPARHADLQRVDEAAVDEHFEV